MEPATIAGRYQIAGRLGEGGMSRVYLCWDPVHTRWCAVKVITEAIASIPLHRARLLQEARAMGGIPHPSVLELYDLVDDVARPFLVMAHAAGGNLQDRVEQGGPLSVTLAAGVMANVCAALHAAHGVGTVHRDIKPSNLLLLASGQVQVGDFGVARAEQELRLTRQNMTVGTLAYMAPEQGDDPRAANPSSDVFSAGAVLYAILVGTRPTTLVGNARSASLAQLPEEVRGIIAAATEPDPGARIASAATLHALLAPLAGGLAMEDGVFLLTSLADPAAAQRNGPPQPPFPVIDPTELNGTATPWTGQDLVPGVLRAPIAAPSAPVRAPGTPPMGVLPFGVVLLAAFLAGGCGLPGTGWILWIVGTGLGG